MKNVFQRVGELLGGTNERCFGSPNHRSGFKTFPNGGIELSSRTHGSLEDKLEGATALSFMAFDGS